MIVKIILILFLVTFASAWSRKKNESWDFLVLTVEWPPAYRLGRENCSNISQVNGWNIHGLWPSSSKRNDPECCKNASKFNITELKPIMKELMEEWNPLGHCSEGFWEHEWDNHGTCAIKDKLIKNLLQYFNVTIQMKRQIDITGLLSKNNVIPDKTKLYTMDNVINAVKKQLNVAPKMQCMSNKDKIYIIAISICFNPDLKVIECPKRHHMLWMDRHHKKKCGRRSDSTWPIRIGCDKGFIYPPFL